MENLNLFMKNQKNNFPLELRKSLKHIYNNLLLMKIILCLFIILYSFLYLNSFNNKKYAKNLSLKNERILYNINESDIIQPFIKQQNDFCKNLHKYYDKKIEKGIQLNNIKLNGLSYKIYTFKKKNGITMSIIK